MPKISAEPLVTAVADTDTVLGNVGGVTSRVPVSLLGGSGGATYATANASSSTLPAGSAAATHASGTGVVPANASDNLLNAVGLVVADVAPSAAGKVQIGGALTLADWTASTGSATLAPRGVYYLDVVDGGLTLTPPSMGGQVAQQIGRAVSPTTLAIEVLPATLL